MTHWRTCVPKFFEIVAFLQLHDAQIRMPMTLNHSVNVTIKQKSGQSVSKHTFTRYTYHIRYRLWRQLYKVFTLYYTNVTQWTPPRVEPWAPAGDASVCTCTPRNLKMTSYAVYKQNTPRFLLAPPALAQTNLKLGIKTQKLTKNRLFSFVAQKLDELSALTSMQLELYMCRMMNAHYVCTPPPGKQTMFCTPPGEISAGAHGWNRRTERPKSSKLYIRFTGDNYWLTFLYCSCVNKTILGKCIKMHC